MSATSKPKRCLYFRPRFFIVLKFAAVVICITLFIILMADVWNKFTTGMTTTGFQVIKQDNEFKEFPCFAIRLPHPYRKRGFFWTMQEYLDNTFGLEEIFSSESIVILKNSSRYKIKEVRTIINGRVFVLCPLKLFKALDRFQLYLLKDKEFELFFFNPDDEFWFVFPRFLVQDSHTLIDTKKAWSADVAISEQKKKYLMKDSQSCNEYEGGGFALCIKSALTIIFEKKLECVLPGLEETAAIGDSNPVYCTDRTSAKKAFKAYLDVIYEALKKPSAFGCPIACTQSVFDIYVKYFHETAFIQFDEDEPTWYGKVFYTDVFYSTLNVEEHSEKLIYDTGTFLAAAGGNLGLMLGVSCLSVFYAIINVLREHLAA